MSNIRRQFKKRINEKQDSIIPMPAVVGDDNGNVYDADRNIYVRIAGQVQKIKNSNISPLYNQKVWVGYEPTQPNTFKILNERTSSGEGNVITPAKHAHTHEWMGHGVGGGTDVVKVQLGQFMPLRVMPYSEFKIMIYPGLARVGDHYVLIADMNDAGKPIPKIVDLLNHAFVDTGKEAYVIVTIDINGDIQSAKGDEVTLGTIALTDIPPIPDDTQYVLAAVRFYSGIMSLQENRGAKDIVDLRFPMAHNHPSGEITGISWDEVNKTGSDIADLAAKSHTSLTDIGVHTHEEIDEYISKSATEKVTAVGDMVYGVDATFLPHNHALVASGASATAISEYGGNVAGNVIDEDDLTAWAGASNPVADDWIYINLGQVRTIHRFRMYQYPYSGAWGATSYKIQGSNDGSSWTDIVTITPAADDETIDFVTAQTYQYFRFYALAGGSNSWQIFTLELLELIPSEIGLDNLPIGTEGQHLVVDSGLPAWADNTAGASALSDLTDVDLTGLADDDILVYDSTSSKWLPEAQSGGGGGSLTVEEADGTPSVASVIKIKVTNGTLTDDGSGVVSLDFGSAATDGAAIHDNEANEISAITEKTTPSNDDLLLIEDSDASYVKKKLKISNLPSSGGGSGETDVLMVQVFT